MEEEYEEELYVTARIFNPVEGLKNTEINITGCRLPKIEELRIR